jgi:nicotinamidase-related amidase
MIGTRREFGLYSNEWFITPLKRQETHVEKSSLLEIINPAKTVLVVWDVQNMLVDSIFNKTEFLENNNKLIDAARNSGVPVFFSKITPLPHRFESPVSKMFVKRLGVLKFSPEGFELAIKPQENDIVMPKHTASMFIGTHFEHMLRNAGIGTIVFSGIATEIGVESSARDASNRGFFPVIAEDAVSSRSPEAHQRSLLNMRNMFIAGKCEDIISIWNNT